MIIVLKENAKEEQLNRLEEKIKEKGLSINKTRGTTKSIWGLVGDTSCLDVEILGASPAVDFVKRIQKPYRDADRKGHPTDTVISLGKDGDLKIGGGNFQVIAGPCSVENWQQLHTIGEGVKTAGATILRGGAFKPRTSPYTFQGLGEEGIKLLSKAKKYLGMPIITEVMDISHIEMFEDVDIIQVGARNMQNYALLKELGHLQKPILLKRGNSSTLLELLQSAEYIMDGGNENVILCERGIRTFETATRNTLDLSAIPLLKSMTHLPVIVDPSHACGVSKLVLPMAMAATISGADGLMIEVHNDPECALCDGLQAINLEEFNNLMKRISEIRPFAYNGR